MTTLPTCLPLIPLLLLASLAAGEVATPTPAPTPPLPPAPAASSKWEKEWAALEALPAPEPGTIAAFGSSSLRLWKTLAQDLAGLPVWNRAFGGARTADLLPALPRLILPHKPKVLIYYCGDNDLTTAAADPEVPVANFTSFVAALRQTLPRTRIVYLAIKPSPSRAAAWPLAQKANAAIAAWSAAHDPRITVVDTSVPLLGLDGQPDPALYQKDRLHLDAEGYRRWTALIKPVVEQAWAAARAETP